MSDGVRGGMRRSLHLSRDAFSPGPLSSPNAVVLLVEVSLLRSISVDMLHDMGCCIAICKYQWHYHRQ